MDYPFRCILIYYVTPRKRCVSRNYPAQMKLRFEVVTPRKRCVSRNVILPDAECNGISHTSQEVCE